MHSLNQTDGSAMHSLRLMDQQHSITHSVSTIEGNSDHWRSDLALDFGYKFEIINDKTVEPV